MFERIAERFKAWREKRLIARANRLLEPQGCRATGIAPYYSVGTQGDNRVYGPVLYVAYPPGTTTTRAGEIATKLINNLPGSKISRVLMEIATEEKS